MQSNTILLDVKNVIAQNERMLIVNYIAIACSFCAFVLSLIAIRRVAQFVKASEDLDWETLANLTGDIGALKRTCQTLNNRLNGMNKASIPQEEIMQQFIAHQANGQITPGRGG